MSECEHLRGRLRKICEGTVDLPLEVINRWRKNRWGLEPLAEGGNGQEIPKRKTVKPQKSLGVKSRIGTMMHQIIERETGAGTPCSECRAAITALNQMTPEEAQTGREAIIADIASRAETNAPHFWQRIAVKADRFLGTGVVHEKIGQWLDEAIQTGSLPNAKTCKAQKKTPTKTKAVQRRQERPEIVPVPLDSPIRNLIFHCYPVWSNESLWRWHVEEIKRRLPLFNGRRIVAIATDNHTSIEAEVREAFGDGFEFLSFANKPDSGESVTFQKLLQAVQSTDPNEITLYAHTKGVSYLPNRKLIGKKKPWHEPDLMRHWSAQMYAANLDRIDAVEESLISHGICGAFRKHKPLGGAGNHGWYYSGAFFWFRHAHTFSRDWQRTAGGRLASEAWPGMVFDKPESACLCGDHAGHLYDPKEWAKLDRLVDAFLKKTPEIVVKPSVELTLITPTGDRPDAFGLCERWMARQSYAKPYQWIVVDDGSVKTHPTLGQEYIRRQPRRGEGHTLTLNLRTALPLARGEKILVIEDDEWYRADYLEKMAAWLNQSPMAGAGFGRYYWPRVAHFRELPEHIHASLCRTGIRREMLGALAMACQTRDPSVDLRLWERNSGQRHDGEILVVGMKGMPGRKSGGGSHTNGQPDSDLSNLQEWIGEDIEHYRRFLPKPIEQLKNVVVYTVVLGGYDQIRPPIVIHPGVRYVAITDGKAPAPWEVIRVPHSKDSRHESRRLKILGPELYFPSAAWTIYYDGQLQMAVDPMELMAECRAWGDADFYLFHHQDRDCIYTEAEEVKRIRRDRPANIDPQIERYRQAGFPESAGLYLGGMLIRTPGASGFNAAWWHEVRQGSFRDQISLPVALAESGVAFQALPAMWWTHFFLRHKHKHLIHVPYRKRHSRGRGT